MPGFAVQSQSAASEGKAGGIVVQNVGTVQKKLIQAVKKTRITNITATNIEGGILPISLLVHRYDPETLTAVEAVVVKDSRVFKTKELLMTLVDQDPRVGADKMSDFPHTEIVLFPGESLYAVAPLDNSFDLSVTYFEGIS